MTRTQGAMEGFCCIEGVVGTSEQLCAAVHVLVAGLPHGQEYQVGCQKCARPLDHGRPRLRPSLLVHTYVHPHTCRSFLCCTDARAMADNLRSTPHPNSITYDFTRQVKGCAARQFVTSYLAICHLCRDSDGSDQPQHPFLFRGMPLRRKKIVQISRCHRVLKL